MVQSTQIGEDFKLELIVQAQNFIREKVRDQNVIPIRETRGWTVDYLRQKLREEAGKSLRGVHWNVRIIRKIVEDAVSQLGYGKYEIGLRRGLKGIPKQPYEPTFVKEPVNKSGQQYYVRRPYAESFIR
ncbi:hypothetical protein HYY71_04060 [Candidatus Woesearchaeota archaeon]|nr:hypothetical protein [Candidatus Woesearchaeota archaeon]